MSFFEAIQRVETTLGPISQDYWEKFHQWPADEILTVINEDHVVDLGSGCGLFGIYAVYTNQIGSVELWEGDSEKMAFARGLAAELGVTGSVTFNERFAEPEDIVGKTVVSLRMGSMTNFERFFVYNRLVTLRRTSEVEPYFIRRTHLPWDISIVKRADGFELELMQHDFKKFLDVLEGERWMEDLAPLLSSIKKDENDERTIGQDKGT